MKIFFTLMYDRTTESYIRGHVFIIDDDPIKCHKILLLYTVQSATPTQLGNFSRAKQHAVGVVAACCFARE